MSCVVQDALDARAAEEDNQSYKQNSQLVSSDKVTQLQTDVHTDMANITTYITTGKNKVTTSHVTSVVHTTSTQAITSVTEEAKAEESTINVPVTEPPVVQPPAESVKPVAPVSPGGSVQGSSQVSDSYFDKCVFIGDSHIKGLSGYGIISDSRVFAQNGLSLPHLSEKVKASDVQAMNPEHIYIMMGTNGVMWSDWNDMIQKYKSFTDSLVQAMPQADIYILSIPPVTADRESKADVASGKYLNSDIDGYNNKLLDMAKSNGWYYLDVNSALKDGNGYLGSSTDGVHMSKELYTTFKNYILTHVVSQ